MSTATAAQITVNRKALDAAFRVVSGAAPSRSPRPIIQNVLLRVDDDGNASVFATDLEVSVLRTVGAVEGSTGFAMVLNPQRLGPILATTRDDSLAFECDGDRITISGESCSFTLACEDPRLFPVQDDEAATSVMRLDAAELKRAIRRTGYAVDLESTRYALSGVILDRDDSRWVMIGTDGRRLAKQVISPEIIGDASAFEGRPVIPAKAIRLVERSLDEGTVDFTTDGRTCRFDLGETRIWSRLVEGRYPRWQDAIPQGFVTRVPLASADLLAVVQQAKIVTSEESKGVDFTLTSDRLSLATTAADVGASKIEMACEASGPDQVFALDPDYLVDALKSLDGAEVRLEVVDKKTGVSLKAEDGFQLIVMPLTRPE